MKTSAKENLLQIRDLLGKISPSAYTQKPEVLYGASIGQHIRHILEIYMLLVAGSFAGTISYDKRKRDAQIENEPSKGMEAIDKILTGIDTLHEKMPVKLEADYTALDGGPENQIDSSVGRELAYCLEHSIHHQALIKAGLINLGLAKLADEDFGVAYSTIRYRKTQCAQ